MQDISNKKEKKSYPLFPERKVSTGVVRFENRGAFELAKSYEEFSPLGGGCEVVWL